MRSFAGPLPLVLLLWHTYTCHSFKPAPLSTRVYTQRAYQNNGGQISPPGLVSPQFQSTKYTLVPCPSSLRSQIAYLSNLPEFLTDVELSNLLFPGIVVAPPLMIARKADTSSLRYGYVAFQDEGQRDDFVRSQNGRTMGENEPFVLETTEFGSKGPKEAKLPLELVQFVLGEKQAALFAGVGKKGRIHGDDVERLSRGQPAKQKGRGSRGVPHRLNSEERGEFERSERRGYLRLDGTGYRRERKGSPLANSWRQRNDARAKPTLVMMKATGRDLKGRRDVRDTVCVDWSTMREPGNDNLRKAIEESTRLVAGEEGMEEVVWDEGAGDEGDFMAQSEVFKWDSDPIWKLPALNLTFEGDRSRAQAMCKALALSWGTAWKEEEGSVGRGAKSRKDAGAKGGGKTKANKTKRRSRGGGKSSEDQLKDFLYL